ncbi:MAG: hypothetical protein QM817_39435 [Archangium sp.]
MSSTPKTTSSAVRNPTLTSRTASQTTKAETKTVTAQPQPTGLEKTEYQRNRDADAFQAAVKRMLEPQAQDTAFLSSRGFKAMESVNAKLSGLYVSSGDAKSALATLNTLEPRDFKLAMDQLSSSGKLQSLVNADGSAFLSVAASKGYVAKEAVSAPQGRFEPPAAPSFYKMDNQLPSYVNDAIHAESKQQYGQYKEAFASYLGRYESAVKATRNEGEIKALGRPASPSTRRESFDANMPKQAEYSRDWSTGFASNEGAYVAVNKQLEKFAGGRADGSFWAEAEAEGTLGTTTAEGKLASDLGGEGKVGTNLTFEAGHEKALSVKQFANGESKVKLDLGVLEVEAEFSKEGKLEAAGGKLAGAGLFGGAKLNREGELAMAGGVDVHVGKGKLEVGGSVTVAPRKREMTAGVEVEGKLSEDKELKLRVGAGAKGLTPATARQFREGTSVFDK